MASFNPIQQSEYLELLSKDIFESVTDLPSLQRSLFNNPPPYEGHRSVSAEGVVNITACQCRERVCCCCCVSMQPPFLKTLFLKQLEIEEQESIDREKEVEGNGKSRGKRTSHVEEGGGGGIERSRRVWRDKLREEGSIKYQLCRGIERRISSVKADNPLGGFDPEDGKRDGGGEEEEEEMREGERKSQ